MKFTTPYTHNRERSEFFATINNEESMTQQSDKDDADINIIMSRFQKSGQLPQVKLEPLYADFTDTPDYRTAVEMIQQADEAFSMIPARIRAQFDNNPQEFIAYALNPAKENREQMAKWGLTQPEQPPKVTLADLNTTLKEALKPKESNDNGKNIPQ